MCIYIYIYGSNTKWSNATRFTVRRVEDKRNEGKYLSSFGPWRGLFPAKPIMFRWSFTIIMSPTLYVGFRPPAAFVAIRWVTPTSFITLTGMAHCVSKREKEIQVYKYIYINNPSDWIKRKKEKNKIDGQWWVKILFSKGGENALI